MCRMLTVCSCNPPASVRGALGALGLTCECAGLGRREHAARAVQRYRGEAWGLPQGKRVLSRVPREPLEGPEGGPPASKDVRETVRVGVASVAARVAARITWSWLRRDVAREIRLRRAIQTVAGHDWSQNVPGTPLPWSEERGRDGAACAGIHRPCPSMPAGGNEAHLRVVKDV